MAFLVSTLLLYVDDRLTLLYGSYIIYLGNVIFLGSLV